MEHKNIQRIPYWKWVPTAFALSGIIVLIFATYGPPASSSGFVSTLKGFFEWAAPDYAAAKAHYKAIPGRQGPLQGHSRPRLVALRLCAGHGHRWLYRRTDIQRNPGA
jgi:hypothetical protein